MFFPNFVGSVFLCFLVLHFLKTAIFNSLSGKSPCCWGQLMEDYCELFNMFYFLNLSCFLKFCIAVFVFEVAVNLLQYLLTYFGREIRFISPAGDTVAFSDLLCLLHTFTPFCGRILKTECPLSILHPTRQGAKSLLFTFLRVELKRSVCGLSLASRFGSAFYMCPLSICLLKVALVAV